MSQLCALLPLKVFPFFAGALVLALAALAPGQSRAASLTTLYNFCSNTPATCADGAAPAAGLIADTGGDLFGTTQFGGANGVGTVFEIAKTAGGYASAPTTLVNFDYTAGAVPLAGLIVDAGGDLFGTVEQGAGFGTLFGLSCTSFSTVCTSYASAPTTFVNFGYSNGAFPVAGLIADAGGNLFGTTELGGDPGYGTVFELPCTSFATVCTSYNSTPTTLVNFDNTTGAFPRAGLIADAAGNLFGTTGSGGTNGYGTVFEIPCNSFSTVCTSYASSATTLVSFDDANGAGPAGNLIEDAAGNLFGTTGSGGTNGYGTVFEIPCNSFSNVCTSYANAPIILYNFCSATFCADGGKPLAGLIEDAAGNLFGTTKLGGAAGHGTVFELSCTSFSTVCTTYASAPTILVSFNSSDGAFPLAGLIADASGNLFGTTSADGADWGGTVFELTGTGFVPWRSFAGTPGQANCRGVSVSALKQAYGSIDAAAAALGFTVKALQSAITTYCAG